MRREKVFKIRGAALVLIHPLLSLTRLVGDRLVGDRLVGARLVEARLVGS